MFDTTIEPALPDHVATTFEAVCQEAIWEAIRRGRIDSYSEVGRWWYGEDEIDIVGLAPSDDRIVFAECKWTTDPVGRRLVDRLQRKAETVRWGPADRTEEFVLFSKSGFVDGLEDELNDAWSLFSLTELDAVFS